VLRLLVFFAAPVEKREGRETLKEESIGVLRKVKHITLKGKRYSR